VAKKLRRHRHRRGEYPWRDQCNLHAVQSQVSDSWYYSLQASNNVSGRTNNSSGWVQLTVLSSPTPLSAGRPRWPSILLRPRSDCGPDSESVRHLLRAELFNGAAVNGGANVTVTNGATVFTFEHTGASASISDVTSGLTGQYSGASTGDTNLDLVLNTSDEIFPGAASR